MALFSTTNAPVNRRILIGLGAALVLSGLLMQWLDDGERDANITIDEALKRVQEIEAGYPELDIETWPTDAPDDESENQEPSEMALLVQSTNFDGAPEPAPQLVEGEDFDLYINTTAAYLSFVFDRIGYTGEMISTGETTAIPPLIVVSIPKGWAEDMTVQYKKSIFYRVMLPLILLENDAVLTERSMAERYRDKLRNRTPTSPEEREKIRELCLKYRVVKADDPSPLNLARIEALLLRVDMIPPSMALGQAAYESGYATSRFAHTGNALFGQWDWSKDRIKPTGQRDGMGDYGIKSFKYPIDSVRAYFWNLNTHGRYEKFRTMRGAQRNGQRGRVTLDGLALAGTLTAYSERGTDYTKELQGIMSFNRLTLADPLRLLNGDPIYFD